MTVQEQTSTLTPNQLRINDLKSKEKALAAEFKLALAALESARKNADSLRKRLQDAEAERLLLERSIVTIKKLPSPATCRKKQRDENNFSSLKSLFGSMTEEEKTAFLRELTE